MKRVLVVALLVCLVVADYDFDDYAYGMGGWTPSVPLAIPYPLTPGATPQPSVAPLRPVMGVDEPSVVSVGEVSGAGGSDVDLPPPPPYKPEISTLAAGECWECEDKVAYMAAQQKLDHLLERIAAKQKQLDSHDEWLDSAKHSITRVQQQIAMTQQNHDQLESDMERLQEQKEKIDQETERTNLINSLGLQQQQQPSNSGFDASSLGLDELSTEGSLDATVAANAAETTAATTTVATKGAADETAVKSIKFRQIKRRPRQADAMKQSQQDVLDKLDAFQQAQNQLESLH